MAIRGTEIKQLVRGTLLANADVVAVVGEQVFASNLENAAAGTVLDKGPLITFEFLSGFARYAKSVQNQTIELYGYSKVSGDQAMLAYDVAFEALQAECLTLDGIVPKALAREIQRPVEGRNENIGAWFARGRWNIVATG